MMYESAQELAMLFINICGIGILIWILVLVHRQGRAFKEMAKQIKILEKAREQQEDK